MFEPRILVEIPHEPLRAIKISIVDDRYMSYYAPEKLVFGKTYLKCRDMKDAIVSVAAYNGERAEEVKEEFEVWTQAQVIK